MASKRLSLTDRRRQTLDRVVELFARQGFKGTTTRQLAKAAGINEALLYRMFGSKRGIFRAIIERKIEESGDAIYAREAAAAEDDRVVFETVAEVALADMTGDPTFIRLLLYSALGDHDLSRMFYEERISKVVGFISGYIQRRQEAGALRAGDPQLLALSFLGMLFNYMLTEQIFEFTDLVRDHQVVAGTVVDLFLRGLQVREGER